MKIPQDKLQHLAMGVAAALVALLAIRMAALNLGAALALVTTAFGVFYEVQQWYRREGKPEVLDAVATAAPGWIAWLAMEVWK